MATTSGSPPVFLDTNVLIRANVQTAPLHEETLAAVKKLYAQGGRLWVSRQVLREYMAAVTRTQTFMLPMPAPTVAERVRYFESRLAVADDTAEVTARLLVLLETNSLGGRQIHDASIVATMPVYNVSP